MCSDNSFPTTKNSLNGLVFTDINMYTSGISRNLMLCIHMLETMNRIVYLVGGGLGLGDWFWNNISMAKSQSSISMLF